VGGPLSGQLIAAAKEACRGASPRQQPQAGRGHVLLRGQSQVTSHKSQVTRHTLHASRYKACDDMWPATCHNARVTRRKTQALGLGPIHVAPLELPVCCLCVVSADACPPSFPCPWAWVCPWLAVVPDHHEHGGPGAGVRGAGARRAGIVREEMRAGSGAFTVHAHMPVAESFGFAEELPQENLGGRQPTGQSFSQQASTGPPAYSPSRWPRDVPQHDPLLRK